MLQIINQVLDSQHIICQEFHPRCQRNRKFCAEQHVPMLSRSQSLSPASKLLLFVGSTDIAAMNLGGSQVETLVREQSPDLIWPIWDSLSVEERGDVFRYLVIWHQGGHEIPMMGLEVRAGTSTIWIDLIYLWENLDERLISKKIPRLFEEWLNFCVGLWASKLLDAIGLVSLRPLPLCLAPSHFQRSPPQTRVVTYLCRLVGGQWRGVFEAYRRLPRAVQCASAWAKARVKGGGDITGETKLVVGKFF